jgi:Ca-activated chloride channel family protein
MYRTYKIGVFIVLLQIFYSSATAQKISKDKCDALNYYVEYMNFCVDNLTNEMKCLYDYYVQVERYRNSKHNHYKLNPKATCAGKDDKYEYNKAKTNISKLNREEETKLNKILDSLHFQYNAIINLSRELEVYNRLRDYETDDFKGHDESIFKIKESYKKYKRIQNELSETIYSIYRNYQAENSKNQILNHEILMRKYLDDELVFFNNWTYNFEKDQFTGKFPYKEIIKSINTTDQNYYPYNFKLENAYPASSYMGSFWGNVRSIQSVKRNAIDEFTYEEHNRDVVSNETYRSYMNYMNNVVIDFFNRFAKAASSNTIYLLQYTKFAPVFTIDKNRILFEPKIVKYIPDNDFIFQKIIESSKPLSKEEARALNNYVEYINEEIRISRDRARLTTVFMKTVDKYKKYSGEELKRIKPSNIRTSKDYRHALSLFHIAVNDSRFLPESFAEDLNKLVKSVNIICDNIRHTEWEIGLYLQSEKYKKDNFLGASKLIKEYISLWEAFDAQSATLYNFLTLIYDSYPAEHPDSPWQKSSDALISLINENHKLLADAKKHYLNDVNMSMTIDSVNLLCRNVLLDEYKNMDGLKRIGRNHGHCPFTPYEDIPEDSKRFALNYQNQKDAEKDPVLLNKYQDMVRMYNAIVEDYNKFVWLAKGEYDGGDRYTNVYLLKAKKELDIIRFIEPINKEKKHLIRDDEEDLFISMEGYAQNNLVLLLDVSQSMNKPEKLPLLKNSFIKLLSILRPEDKAAIVIYSGEAELIMESTSCAQKDKIISVLENLDSGGSTNIERGIKTAYKSAKNNYIEDGNNRIILATDGEFEVDDKLKKLVKKISHEQICFSIFHYGKNKSKKTSLLELSQAGNGNYALITETNSDIMLVKEAKAIKSKE